MMPTKKRTHIKQIEMIALNDLLRTICTSEVVNDKKVATYAKPWNDAIVLKEIQKTFPNLGIAQIQNFRLTVYGEVPHKARDLSNQHTGSKIGERQDRVEARLARLEVWATDNLGYKGVE